MRPKSKTLTGQELEIMKIIWELGDATVRDVYETLRLKRQVAYTTVLTLMKIMEEKKYLKKSSRDRAHVYTAAKPKSHTIKVMIDDFVSRVFNGSAEPLLLHLVEERALSEKELKKLERLLRERK